MSTITCRDCGRKYEGEAMEGLFEGACPKCLAGFALKDSGGVELSPGLEGQQTVVDAEPLPLQPGASFRGLEVMEVLGRGGMGIVYKARQAGLDRFVALKILSPKLAPSPVEGLATDNEFARRFEREARALATLDHSNIVRVLDFGVENDLYFFTMDFVDGLSLRELMRSKRLEAAEALKIVPQICEALEFAHSKGVVHRDIKPENILIDREGRVKIADFGLAKLVDRAAETHTMTRTNVAMGTPHYMAPEQYSNLKGVDHRADIYSLGVVFYEMLTGEVPAGSFLPPSQKVHIDVRLDEVVLKAMAREPERRYQRVAEVKTGIEEATSTVGRSAVSQPPPSKHEDDLWTSPITTRTVFQRVVVPFAFLLGIIGTAAKLPLLSVTGWGICGAYFTFLTLRRIFFMLLTAWHAFRTGDIDGTGRPRLPGAFIRILVAGAFLASIILFLAGMTGVYEMVLLCGSMLGVNWFLEKWSYLEKRSPSHTSEPAAPSPSARTSLLAVWSFVVSFIALGVAITGYLLGEAWSEEATGKLVCLLGLLVGGLTSIALAITSLFVIRSSRGSLAGRGFASATLILWSVCVLGAVIVGLVSASPSPPHVYMSR